MKWLLVLLAVVIIDLQSVLTHTPTLSAIVRDLPVVGRVAVVAVGIALLIHLVLPAEFAERHDPLDLIEHEVHRQIDNR